MSSIINEANKIVRDLLKEERKEESYIYFKVYYAMHVMFMSTAKRKHKEKVFKHTIEVFRILQQSHNFIIPVDDEEIKARVSKLEDFLKSKQKFVTEQNIDRILRTKFDELFWDKIIFDGMVI